MLVVYSKKTGKIKNILIGDQYKEIKDCYCEDYIDYEQIYNCMNIEDDLIIRDNFDFFKVLDEKLVLKDKIANRLKNDR
ncbi:MAG: hypothetical protein ACRCWG_13520 [Sarcina sp.]